MLVASYLSLIFLGLFAYLNAIFHPFVHDDLIFIVKNPQITDLSHWYQVFQIPAAADGLNTYYRPILEIIYRLEYYFWGPYPWVFHLVNVILHIINGLLLFGLLQRFGLRQIVAWVIAVIFLIHPVQTEAVACISGISNLWMALGILLALHAYLGKWYGLSLIAFVLAFLGKEQAIMFVPLVMVIDYSQGEKNYRSWVLWAVAAGFLLWLRQSMTGASLFKDITVSPGELYLRLEAVPRDIEMYLRLIFYPYDLHYYRSTDILQSNVISLILASVILLVIIYIFKRKSQSRPILILGVGWFLATLSPVLNIAPLINEYSFILTPEHFLYLPIVGILIIVVFALDKSFHSVPLVWNTKEVGCISIVTFVIISCLLITWHQNNYWSSEVALFERMIQYEPNFGKGHWLLAKAYYAEGRYQEADEHFKRSYIIMSDYEKKATNSIARNFYIRYENQILSDWWLNKKPSSL